MMTMKFCIALAGALIAGEAAAFAPATRAPPMRAPASLCMTQEPPAAKLELPRAKLEAVAVNSVQWGIDAAVVPAGVDLKSVMAKLKFDLDEAESAGAAALPKAVAEQEVLSDITSSFMSKLNKIASSSTDKLAKM
mmetsp:Transcript_3400/g.4885  ORF Transcript_3400/g.4885 Transcript_3400/m.4885 type:complete len:136 (+) Transcript_3400:125-532(+)